jgi:L-asparaginase
MRNRFFGAFAILAVCASFATDAQAAKKATTTTTTTASADRADKPNIVVLATGGTIAGAQMDKSKQGYKSGTFQVGDLIAAVPSLTDMADLTGEQVVNIGSQDMNDAVWLQLSKRVNEVLKDPKVDGVVITHGTDTMEETSFFLQLTVKSDKPVVMVGSQRPATAVGADGPANLYNAVAVATNKDAKGRGVLVVMNDQIHSARTVEKMDTINLQTMTSPDRGPAGLVNTGKVVWLDPPAGKHTSQSEFDISNVTALPRVDIIYAHANMSPDLITAAINNGAKGIVVAGVGDGNMTKDAVAVLQKAVKEKGILVIRSTRLATGFVLRNSEVNDDEMGFVASGEFNPGKSRVLAQLALLKTNDPKLVQTMFYTY